MSNPYKARKALHSGTTPYINAMADTQSMSVGNIILQEYLIYVNDKMNHITAII